MQFDFEEWRDLAASDPEAFERRRLEAIEALIAQAPERERQRLRGLQFRIDMERQRSSNPLGACVRISRMMWERFNDLQHALEDLGHTMTRPPNAEPIPVRASESAEIVPFPKRR
ncbi:MAG: DUF3135 domain-containing protein [Burkholderiales bacterium]|nr:DUF3135 domain-containing protein [Burkholderiales bacterium]